ncbi:hypothetical protein LJC11_03070 [Bacteroidales bacterium OttesenSCG-928-I21]|nr:hypothetical protein [Bacteroidales bacterium OttesenSCG-928-I21]
MNKNQLRDLIKRVLRELDLYSKNAEDLLMGTAAQESHLGEYIRQIKGPALGIFQMEPATFSDIENNYLRYKPDLKAKIKAIANIQDFSAEQLEYNLALAICMCRVHYLRVKSPIPSSLDGYARYWKEHYNTHKGRGTVEEFISNYKKYVL